VQKGLWLTTAQLAPTPHVPGQGSPHRWLRQAWVGAHSAFEVHSGRQEGGAPIKLGRHEHTAC